MGKHDEQQRMKRWHRWTEAEAKEELKAFAESGKTLAAYARDRGITTQRLFWWRKRLALKAVPQGRAVESTRPTKLIPAVVKTPTPTPAPMPRLFSAATLTVQIPGGVVIEICDPQAVPPEWATSFVAGLMRPPR